MERCQSSFRFSDGIMYYYDFNFEINDKSLHFKNNAYQNLVFVKNCQYKIIFGHFQWFPLKKIIKKFEK